MIELGSLRWLPLLCVVFGFGSVSYTNNIAGSGNYAGTLLVVGDCQATVPAARTPTTAAGRMGTPATARSFANFFSILSTYF